MNCIYRSLEESIGIVIPNFHTKIISIIIEKYMHISISINCSNTCVCSNFRRVFEFLHGFNNKLISARDIHKEW